jgi:hypothetical protein
VLGVIKTEGKSPNKNGRTQGREEVSVMFKWMQSRRDRRRQDSVPEPQQVERDSGEEEYESHEEDELEVGPSGMTRAKTDNI